MRDLDAPQYDTDQDHRDNDAAWKDAHDTPENDGDEHESFHHYRSRRYRVGPVGYHLSTRVCRGGNTQPRRERTILTRVVVPRIVEVVAVKIADDWL